MSERKSAVVHTNPWAYFQVKSMNMEFLGKWFQESSKEAVLAGHMTKHSGDIIHISTHKFVRMPIDQVRQNKDFKE